MSKIKRSCKRFLTGSLCFFLICSFLSVGVRAEDNQNDNVLSVEEKKILDEIYEIDPNYEYEGELVSVTKETRVMETQDQILKNDPGALSRGAIGNNYMSIYVTTSRIKQTGKDTFDIKATATWKSVPFFRMQDAFAIAWGGNFALISSKATASYFGVGVLSGKTSQVSMSPNAGVGYSVEASDWYGQALQWTRIEARISQNDRSGQANVSAAYCHRTASIGGVGISFGGSNASISFSVAGGSDTMANYTSFSY